MMDTKSRTDKATGVLLVLIVLAVGAMAGAASFHHVHDWTIDNSPAGTADWFGWANAVITELIPTAALIIIGKRRASGKSIGYPMFLLVVAVGISLTAQLAEAVATVFGFMTAALPAVAFFALSKLVFSTTKAAKVEELPEVAPVDLVEPETVELAPEPVDELPTRHFTAPPVEQPVPDPVGHSRAALNFLEMARASSGAAQQHWISKYNAHTGLNLETV